METNKNLAILFRQMADLLDYQDVAFKPIAYRRAAQTVESLTTDATRMQKKELLELPGIGEAIADKIIEYGKTGRIKHLIDLKAVIGPNISQLVQVEDLGPKRVRQIQQALGIETVEQLIEAAKAAKLRTLPRFSELMEKKILENALRVGERNKRYPLAEAKPYVDQVMKSLRALKGISRAEVAGSYRRQKATVGDVDILVSFQADASQDGIGKIFQAIAALPFVTKVVASGATKMSFDLTSGLRIDIRFVREDQWGSALLYFTGDKEHNIALRRIAIGKGWKLNEYGLFQGEKVIASKEEADMYKALGLKLIEPSQRRGELPT